MSKILSPLGRRAAWALLATLAGSAPALAEASVQPTSARLETIARPALEKPTTLIRVADAGTPYAMLALSCTRIGTRMVC